MNYLNYLTTKKQEFISVFSSNDFQKDFEFFINTNDIFIIRDFYGQPLFFLDITFTKNKIDFLIEKNIDLNNFDDLQGQTVLGFHFLREFGRAKFFNEEEFKNSIELYPQIKTKSILLNPSKKTSVLSLVISFLSDYFLNFQNKMDGWNLAKKTFLQFNFSEQDWSFSVSNILENSENPIYLFVLLIFKEKEFESNLNFEDKKSLMNELFYFLNEDLVNMTIGNTNIGCEIILCLLDFFSYNKKNLVKNEKEFFNFIFFVFEKLYMKKCVFENSSFNLFSEAIEKIEKAFLYSEDLKFLYKNLIFDLQKLENKLKLEDCFDKKNLKDKEIKI